MLILYLKRKKLQEINTPLNFTTKFIMRITAYCKGMTKKTAFKQDIDDFYKKKKAENSELFLYLSR